MAPTSMAGQWALEGAAAAGSVLVRAPCRGASRRAGSLATQATRTSTTETHSAGPGHARSSPPGDRGDATQAIGQRMRRRARPPGAVLPGLPHDTDLRDTASRQSPQISDPRPPTSPPGGACQGGSMAYIGWREQRHDMRRTDTAGPTAWCGGGAAADQAAAALPGRPVERRLHAMEFVVRLEHIFGMDRTTGTRRHARGAYTAQGHLRRLYLRDPETKVRR